MAAEQKQKLEQQLWNIANTLRGKMDADDFRDYILGFIFYKYLSIGICLCKKDSIRKLVEKDIRENLENNWKFVY